MKVLARQVLIEELWNLAIYGKVWYGASAPDLPGTIDPLLLNGFQCSNSSHVPVLLFWEVGGRMALVLGASEDQNISSEYASAA